MHFKDHTRTTSTTVCMYILQLEMYSWQCSKYKYAITNFDNMLLVFFSVISGYIMQPHKNKHVNIQKLFALILQKTPQNLANAMQLLNVLISTINIVKD